jgi:hypothetical protein
MYTYINIHTNIFLFDSVLTLICASAVTGCLASSVACGTTNQFCNNTAMDDVAASFLA